MRAAEADDNPSGRPEGKVVFADKQAAAMLREHVDALSHPDEGTWRKVKQNVSRTVYRGQVAGGELFLKHFHSRSRLHRLARLLGVSKARRELRSSKYLQASGIPTTVGLAALCHNGVEWLATRAVAEAEPADVWHSRMLASGPAGRRPIARALKQLADIVARMHQAGVIHADLHCGNVLVRTSGDRPKLVLTDLHRIRRRRRLSRRARSANLAMLLHDRIDFTTRAERLRFLKHYLRVAGAEGTLRGWAMMIAELARRHTRRQHAQRDRRVMGNNKYFRPIRLADHWRGHVILASKWKMAGARAADLVLTGEMWREALADPSALLDKTAGEVVKDSQSSLVISRRLRLGENEIDVHIKYARRKRPWKVILDCFRPARSTRAFQLGHKLLTRRIPTALPLAALERRIGPFLLGSLLITETVDGPETNQFLNRWMAWPRQGRAELDEAQKRVLARDVLGQLGRLMHRLHDHSMAHRDLKASNMLIRWDQKTSPQVALIDLDGLRHTGLLTARQRFQGLMRLNVSLLECPAVNRAGRLRMLLGYLRCTAGEYTSFKPYWRALEQWSARKLRQQIRSRRQRQKAVRRPT